MLYARFYPRNLELQEEQVSSFLRAYFGPISSIGSRENSPEIVVIEINEDAQSQNEGPVSDLQRGEEGGLFSLI